MTPKVLLDTDILSALLRQQPAVLSRAIHYLSVFPQHTFSLITRYEILRGFKVKDAKKQLMAFDGFCQSSEILSVTEASLAAHPTCTRIYVNADNSSVMRTFSLRQRRSNTVSCSRRTMRIIFRVFLASRSITGQGERRRLNHHLSTFFDSSKRR